MTVTIQTQNNAVVARRLEELSDAGAVLDATNDALLTGFRGELAKYRNTLNRASGDDATSKAVAAIISGTTPAAVAALSDADKIALLLENQRQLAIMVRENLALINALNTMLSAWREAHARALRAIRRLGA